MGIGHRIALKENRFGGGCYIGRCIVDEGGYEIFLFLISRSLNMSMGIGRSSIKSAHLWADKKAYDVLFAKVRWACLSITLEAFTITPHGRDLIKAGPIKSRDNF